MNIEKRNIGTIFENSSENLITNILIGDKSQPSLSWDQSAPLTEIIQIKIVKFSNTSTRFYELTTCCPKLYSLPVEFSPNPETVDDLAGLHWKKMASFEFT